MREEWDLFKRTWVFHPQRPSIICSEDREDFCNFDNFIASEVWKNEAWISQVSTVVCFKDKIGPVKVFAEKKLIRICYSPFKVKFEAHMYKKPVTFLLQPVIDKLVDCLVKSNPDIKIHISTRNNDEFSEFLDVDD